MSKAGDESDAPFLIAIIETPQQSDDVRRLRTRADLDADRVGDAAEIFDVSTFQLPCALANPEHVRPEIVIVVLLGNKARHRLLKSQHETFMGGVKIHGSQG